RNDMGGAVARLRVAAAIAEGVELLHVAERQSGLRRDPRAQSDFESTMRNRIEGSRWKSGQALILAGLGGGEDQRFVIVNGDNRGGQTNLDRGELGFFHRLL